MKLTKKLQYTPAGQFLISIPNSVVRLKGWKKGDLITFTEDKGNIVLKKE